MRFRVVFCFFTFYTVCLHFVGSMSAKITEEPEKISGWCVLLDSTPFFFPVLFSNLFLISFYCVCCTVACQTTLSLPLAFDLEKVLGKP